MNGLDLVNLGLNFNNSKSFLTTGKSCEKFSNFAISYVDENGIKFYKLANQNFYINLKTTNENLYYWKFSKEQRTEKFFDYQKLGLIASKDFRDCCPYFGGKWNCFCIIAMEKIYKSTGSLTTRGNVYSILKNREDFIKLFEFFPPGDRHIQECILPNTPNKFFLDIEKDFDYDFGNAQDELDFMEKIFFDEFIPFLVTFFCDKIGIQIDEDDIVILNGSKLGLKFSVHVTVVSKQNHFFIDQLDTFVVSNLLAKYCQKKSMLSKEFRMWYFFFDGKGIEKTVIDYCVNTFSTRNMRTIGSCKARNLPMNQHFENSRVLKPFGNRKDRKFEDYIISCYSAPNDPNFTQIELADSIYKESSDYSDSFLNKVVPKWFYGKNIRQKLRTAKRGNLPDLENEKFHFEKRNITFNSNSICSENRDFVKNMARSINNLGSNSNTNLSQLEKELKNGEKILKENFFSVCYKILLNLATIAHPGNSYDANQSNDYGEVFSLHSTAFCQTTGKRRCIYGPCGGQHSVIFRCFSDFSVSYFCYGCRRTDTIIKSPIRIGGIMPKNYQFECPDDFKIGLIDYDQTEPDLENGEDEIHMRKITLTESKSTIVLKGGMGAGKTKTTTDFIHELRNKQPGATILAYSFRKMLAVMFAKSFSLDLYCEKTERSLFNLNGVAIQIDSLERLGEEMTRDSENNLNVRYKADYDVVVVDEIESVLAHFDSSTLKGKLNIVWLIFFNQIKGCKKLVVCDADIGTRTYNFLRQSRSTNGVIEGLQYHINRHVSIATKFFDYLGEYEWVNKMIFFLLNGKNVFFFSNERNYMSKIVDYIETSVRLKIQNRVIEHGTNDKLVEEWTELLKGLIVIDAHSSESTKKNLSNCNESWIHYRLVCISPTVGAGIDFNVKDHFHVSFGYGSFNSCCARGFNQMRGRVRSTIDKECHLYLKRKLEKKPEKLPFSKSAAMEYLLTRRDSYLNDHQPSTTENGYFHIPAQLIPYQLLELQANNMVERNKSIANFRGEFISLVQSSDPNVDYIFFKDFDIQGNIEFKSTLAHKSITVEKLKRARVSVQPDLDKKELQELIRNDKQGRMEKSKISSEDARVVIEKNKVIQFYGLIQNIPSCDFDQILRIAYQDGKTLDLIENICRILFSSIEDLYLTSKSNGSLNSGLIRMETRDGERMVDVVAKQRQSQESWPTDFRMCYWTKKLMYACGFEINGESNFLEDEDLLKFFVGHDGLAKHRLKNDKELQKWLHETVKHISESLQIRSCKRHPPPKKDNDWNHSSVFSFFKKYMSKMFGIDFLKDDGSKKQNGKRKRASTCGCNIHKFGTKVRCRKLVPVLDDLKIKLELARARITAKEIDEKWYQNSKRLILRCCDLLKINTNFKTYLKPRNQEVNEFESETLKIEEYETTEEKYQNRSKKCAIALAKNSFETIREEREKITDSYIGLNPYLLPTADFIVLLLSNPYKRRTRQEISKFKKKIKFGNF